MPRQARQPPESQPAARAVPAAGQRREEDREVVVMGQVLAPYGVKGWLKIRPFTEAVDGLLEHPQWLVATRERPEWKLMRVAEGHAHGAVLVASLEAVDDRTQAEKMVGAQIAVAREDLPAPAADEFYWADLVGLTVVNEQDVVLGAVREILDTGAHAVLRVVGERERLIPFVEAYVREVDLGTRKIRVDWQPDY